MTLNIKTQTMNELPDYYLQLNETYSLADKAHDFVVHRAEWKYIPYIWVIDNSPAKFETWIKLDPFLMALHNKFHGWVDFYITRAHHAHSWHTDAAEKCSINMVFEEYNSHTLFSIKNEQVDIHEFKELKYQPNKWTIINTAKKHTVMNFESRDRFLMCYRPSGGTTYQTVVDWYKNEYSQTV
jgi:hypothetical protein